MVVRAGIPSRNSRLKAGLGKNCLLEALIYCSFHILLSGLSHYSSDRVIFFELPNFIVLAMGLKPSSLDESFRTYCGNGTY